MHSSKVCFGLKLIAVLLVVATVVTLIPKNLTAYGFDSASQSDSAGAITAEDTEQYSIVSRDRASEIDLNSLIFNTKNGGKTEFFYPYDVKYIDDEGLVHDKDTTISKTENGFVSAGTGVNISFPDKLSDGVSVASSDGIYSVVFAPLDSSDSYSGGYLACENSTVRYAGQKASLEYGATFSGLKENIVLNEYSGINSWSFRLRTNGLKLEKKDEQYVLTDANETVMCFGSIIAFTADDRNNTFGELTVETVTESGEYILTVSVSDAWLLSEETAYPVTVDPSIVVSYSSGGSAIQDEILSSTTTYSPYYDVTYVGKGTGNEKLRGVICFPNLNLTGKKITSASLELRDVMCETDATLVEMYEYTGTAWTEAASLAWSTASNYGELLDSHYIKYGGGNAGSDTNRYSFDITSVAQKWAAGYLSPSQGVLLKTTDAFENGSGSFHRCFASKDYGTNSLKPSLIITYVLPKGYNPSFTFDSRTLDDNITVYNYHNHGNILATYSFDVDNTKGFPLPLFYAYNSTDDTWRLSIEETMTSDAGRYRYTDGYGTEYYFSFKSAGTYENEALGLEITVSSSEIVLETDDGIRKSFDPFSGKITALQYDKDTYSYTYNSFGIGSISKNNNALFSFGYNSNFKLSSAFGYTLGYTDGKLTSITDKYGRSTVISRTYYLLLILTSIDFKSSLTTNGIHADIDLNTWKTTNIVTYRGNTSNNITDDSYTYGTGWTSVSSNLAGLDSDDPHNTTVTYIFDENGKTVNEIKTASGKCISAYDYRTDDVDPGSLVGGGEANLFGNTSFETSAWSGGIYVTDDDAVFGSKVMGVSHLSNAYLYVFPTAGTYTFSIYLKGAGTKATLSFETMTGTPIVQSEPYPLSDSWVRAFLTFTVPSQNLYIVRIKNSSTMTFYADCAQLEKNDTPSTYNALQNSGFDSSLSGWTGGTLSQNTIFGSTCEIGPGSNIYQTVTVGSVSEDTSFMISGWISKPSRLTDAEIRLTFHGTNTTSVSVPFDGFASGIAMFSCAQVLPPEGTGDITSVTFSVVNNSSSGYIYVDNLLLSFGSITRPDETDHSSQGLVFYSYGDGTCRFGGIGTCTDTDIVIPDKSPAGDTVRYISAEVFKQNTNIESVTIPDSVIRIFYGAFRECPNLKTVNIGSSVTRIDDAAFYQCTALETVNIPDTVTYIDSSAFSGCTSLKTLVVSENLSTLGTYVFSGCSSLKKVTLPASLASLPAYTFLEDNAGLTIYYTGSSSQWSSMTKGTGALPSNYTLVCDSEIKNGSVYEYTYSNGYKSSVKVTSLETGSPVESYTYDANGNITGYIDSADNETAFVYDANGKLTSATAPGGRTTSYTYNDKGDVASETDPDGNTTVYVYSATTGLLTSQTKGETTVTYSYSNGLVSSVVVSGTNYSMTYSYVYNDYGNIVSVQSGTLLQTVASYTYTCGGRGKLKSKTESNGYCETYSYDNTGNLLSTSVSGNAVYENTFDLAGNCLRSADAYLGTTEISLFTPDGGAFTYTFDSSGTVLKTVTESGIILFANGSEYNELPEDISIDSETDALGRETEYALKLTQNNSESTVFDITRTYLDATTGASPNEVATETFSGAGSLYYSYDGRGNLTEVRDDQNNILLRYTYDAKGQLLREDNEDAGFTRVWNYDANGNIQSRKHYSFTLSSLENVNPTVTMSYGYDPMCKDKLTSFFGTTISYSGLNPTNWRNASSLTWRGRQLISCIHGGVTTTYEYNSDGLRTKRTTGNDVTEYVWNGDRLIKEITDDYSITYLYDGNELIGFNLFGTNYYYAKDAFDVIRHIYTENGNLYCTYSYDAWGNLLDIDYGNPENTLAGCLNRIIYKSYYYDTDIGFYYLQSRFYDPVVGRFLNADDPSYLGVSGTVLGWNLFTYCTNNPVMYDDSNGKVVSPANIIGAIIGGIIGSIGGYFLTRWLADLLKLSGWKRNLFIIGLTAVIGAASAVIGYFIGPYVAKAWNLLTAKLAGLVRGTYRGIATIEDVKMVTKINVAKHLWSRLVGPKVTTTGILSLIYRAIRDGEWRYQSETVIRIVLKVGKEFVVVTGILKDNLFHVGDAWVWDGISNIWGGR